MIAAVLESGDLRRLYTGLSLLVGAAAEGRPARGLIMFGALEPLLDEDLGARATGMPPAFGRTLAELRDAALTLEPCRVWVCSAALELTGTERARAEQRLAGVLSLPQFLREVEGAQLVVV